MSRSASSAPRRVPRRRLLLLGMPALALAGAVAVGMWAHRQGWDETLMARAEGGALGVTATMGLAVGEIDVEGRARTDAGAILRAVGATRGTPMLAVSPVEARRRLEALPWVRVASVERLFPSTLFVRITEREPLALWQRGGKLALIDRDGVVITDQNLERFPGLVVLVGEDAPRHAAALVEMLQTEPLLASRVAAAVRLGSRRWNLRLDNGIDIQLPEKNPQEAWAQLAKVERQSGVLAKNVEAVDMRLSDRLVVRTVPEPPKEPPPKKGRKT
jgi:cell division protein FtsQ